MALLTRSSINGHKPLPEEVVLEKSPIHGYGVFAAKPLSLDYDLGITHVVDSRFPNGFIRTPLGGFINHSFSPNCLIYEEGDTLHIKTITTINPGEELTIDYRPWYTDDEIVSYR